MSEERLDTIESDDEMNTETQLSSSTEEIFIDEDEVERLCLQVKEIFYQIKNKNQRLLNNIIGCRDPYYEKLYTVYEEMNGKKYLEDFWGECTLRLQNALKKSDKEPSEAVQLFTFFVIFAIRSLREKTNPAILDFLAERCYKWSVAKENAVKRDCCMVVGYFFQYFPDIFGDTETQPLAIRNDVKRLRTMFYKLFTRFANDEADIVRNQVCLSVEAIQDQDISSTFKLALKCTPKDYILNLLNDKSPIVRQTAVKCLTAIGRAKNIAVGLFSIAAEELNLEVRKVAISKVVHFWPLEVSNEDREQIIYNNLIFDDDLAGYLKRELLSIWLAQLADHVSQHEVEEKDEITRKGFPEAIHLLAGNFQWQKHDDKIMKICHAIYDVIRRLIHKDKTVTLPEMVKKLIDEQGKVVIISRYNRDVLLGDELPPKHIARYVFFWRAMIQYCFDMTKPPKNPSHDRDHEAERQYCLQKLAPSLKEMCEFITKLNDLKCFTSQKQDNCYMENAILNCIKICYYLDRDPCGLTVLKELLEKLLLDDGISPEGVDYIASVLMKNHYADDEQGLLVHVLNYFSDIIHAEQDTDVIPSTSGRSNEETPLVPTTPSLDDDDDDIIIDDGSLASSFFKANILFKTSPPREPKPLREITSPRMSSDVKKRQIKIINAVLKTGAFKQMNPYLTRLCEKLVPECISSGDDEVTANALNVFTIITLISRKEVPESGKLLFTAAQETRRLPKSSIAGMYGFVDLAVTFEKEIQDWLEDNDYEAMDIFNPLLLNEKCTSEQLFAAVEASAKLLLSGIKDSNDEASITNLASLLARCFHSSIANLSRVHSCMLQCLCVIKLRGRKQMQLLFNALLYMLNEMYNNSDDLFYQEVDAERAAATIVSLSRGCPADDEFKISLHAEQLEAVMEMISRVIDNPHFVKIYCRIGCKLDIEDVDYDDLIRYINRASSFQQELGRKISMDIDIQIDELDKLIDHLNKRKTQIDIKRSNRARLKANKRKDYPFVTSFNNSSQASIGSRSQQSRRVKDASPGLYSDWFL